MKSLREYYCTTENFKDSIETLFEFYPDGVVYKDSNFCYLGVNKSYCDLFSINEPSFLAGKFENPSLSGGNLKLVKDADLEIKNGLYTKNYIINTGQDRILSITSSPVIDNGEFCGIISVVKDITQEEDLKENFVKKHFEYIDTEKNLREQRETFVASISHDLKNPTLAQIRGIELLLKGVFGELKTEQKELLEMVLDSCRYMNGMLSTLLETYRNYDGIIKFNFEEFSFNELVRECVSEMIYIAKDKEIKINISENGGNYVIEADRIQIKRVLMNLLSNGIKYAFKNTELNLFIDKFDNLLNFRFENKSPYIPAEKQKDIFARYVSFAAAYKELGIGLGLYASKKIIEGHGGNIYVKSFPDNINIFGFSIPDKVLY